MADRTIEVVVALGDEDVLAGRLFSHRGQGGESATFAYDSSYLSRSDAYALEPTLPMVQGAMQSPVDLAMFRAFADAAPDRWGRALIRRAEALRARVEGGAMRSPGEIDFLLGVRDDLRQGAVRFRDPQTRAYLASSEAGVPHLTDLARLLQATDHLEADEESEEELRDLLRAGSSLGGARPKAHVIDSRGRIAIAKFPRSGVDEWDVEAWEGVALDLASRSGIRVPPFEVVRLADRNVLIIDRFDRQEGRRIGYVSAMTMLEAKDGDQGSYLDIAAAVEQVSPRTTEDLHELWRRMSFNVLASNTDDHLRNHGFLHAGGATWTLSPAFDLNPNPQPGGKRLSSALDGYDTSASIGTLMSVATFFRLGEPDAKAVLTEVLQATSQWREIAFAAGISQAEIRAMSPAFEHGESEVARDIVGWQGGGGPDVSAQRK